MFDNIFDKIFILIPVALLIGRFILQARNKHKPKPKPKAPSIPVHFEDDVDDKAPLIRAKAEKTDYHVSDVFDSPKPVAAKSFKKPAQYKTAAAAQEKKILIIPNIQPQEDFFQKLNKLSPLKQAVIMAEVLGPPKALQ